MRGYYTDHPDRVFGERATDANRVSREGLDEVLLAIRRVLGEYEFSGRTAAPREVK